MKVTNTSPIERMVTAWSCNKSDNWRADTPKISVGPHACLGNFTEDFVLKPGKSLEATVPFDYDDHTLDASGKHLLPAVPGRKKSFKMGFQSCGSKRLSEI